MSDSTATATAAVADAAPAVAVATLNAPVYEYPSVGEDCADEGRLDWVESAAVYRKSYAADSSTVNGWNESEHEQFKLRGEKYLDGDNSKFPSAVPAYKTCGINILKARKPLYHVARWSPQLRAYIEENKNNYTHFFVVNWMLPGPPFYSVVHLYGRTLKEGEDPTFDLIMQRYIAGDATERNKKFKFICNIVKGPWAVRMAANQLGGSRPALIGTKLASRHYTGANYVEVDVDVGSSKVASMLNGLIIKSAKSLCVDQAYLIEGQSPDELPERLFGCSRFIHCALSEVFTEIDLPESYDEESKYDGAAPAMASPSSLSSPQ